MTTYVALLRGINVGGKNRIRMAALTACFETAGFEDVATYIQSGNVIFAATGSTATQLVRKIETLLADEFGYPTKVVLRSRSQMRAVVDGAPNGFGTRAGHQYDVIFLKEPLTAKTALRDVPSQPGVDDVRPGRGVLYVARPRNKLSRSRLTSVVGMPIYQSMTLRSWSTTAKLLGMMAGPRSDENRGGRAKPS